MATSLTFFYNFKSLVCHKLFTAPLNKMFRSLWQFEFLPLFTVCLLIWSEDDFGMQTVAETNDLLHVLVEFKTLVVLQIFCRRPLIPVLFLKVVIAKDSL